MADKQTEICIWIRLSSRKLKFSLVDCNIFSEILSHPTKKLLVKCLSLNVSKYGYTNLITQLKIPLNSYEHKTYSSFPIFSLLFLFGGAAAPPAP